MPSPPGELVVRPVQEGDVGVLSLLAQLTVVGDTTPAAFAQRVRELASGPEHVFVVVGACGPPLLSSLLLPLALAQRLALPPDGQGGPVLATATLLLERKIARGCGLCGHVEDVVVDATARGRGVGRLLVAALVERARQAGCYKVILDCSRDNEGFYAACGFVQKELQMALYL